MIRNALRRGLWSVAALAVSIVSVAPMSAQAIPAARRITTAVSNSDRVALSGGLRNNLKLATDLGPADMSLTAHHVIMLLERSADRQVALDQYLSDVQNSNSSNYHKWLMPTEFGARFGASTDDVQTISAWLQSQGLKLEKVSPAANMISFSGTVGQMQYAFSTTIHSVSVNGEKHLTNLSAPQVPRALAPAVKGVLGLDDFHPRSNLHLGPAAKFNANTHRIEPNLTLFDQEGDPYLYVDPADAATIYDVPNAALNTAYKSTTYDGTGVTVGIVGDSNVDLAPVTNYRLAFLGETASTVNLPTVIVDGSDPGINGDEVETFLDLEVLGGMAPKAKINYYTSDDSDISAGLFNAMERGINDNQISILSVSFGECEANAGTATNQFINELFEQAAAQGITVTVSSGDSGAAGCDSSSSASATGGLAVNGLGSTPYNISVGGTDYDVLGSSFKTYVDSTTSGTAPYYGTALSYIPESPWNDSTSTNTTLANNVALQDGSSTDVIGAGGGMSSIYTKPAFQTSLTPADGARDMPDVSFLAGNGLYGAVWVLCQSEENGPDCATTNGQFTSSSTFSGVGGTSAATPAFAGMLALVVQATGSRLGQANNVIYKLAADKYSTVFHDVTTGNNSVVCSSNSLDCGTNGFTTGYDAATGYDLASGLGSVDAAQMLTNWSSAVGTSSTATLTINGSNAPLSVTHGVTLNLALAVNPTTATGVAGLVTTATAATGSPTLNGTPYTMAISNGTGSGSYNGLPGGQYTVYATYGGDTNTAASQSNAISMNIAAEASSTMLTVNAYTPSETTISNFSAIPYGSYLFTESSVYGTAEGYTASLGAATGTMTILDNGAPIGTAPITSGNLSSFPSMAAGVYPYAAGTHKLTASFPGDASYRSNTSNEVDFTVLQGPTSVSVLPTLPSLPSVANDPVQVFVQTSSLGGLPTGTITLSANGKTLGSTSAFQTGYQFGTNLAIAYFTFSVPGSELQSGANTLTATYTGDNNYIGSTATGAITVSESNFTLNAGSIALNAGATAGNTSTISAIPTGGFAGVVNLSCTVNAVPANAASPVACGVPSTLDVTGIGTVTATLTASSTASTTAGTYVVTITGIDEATGKITASTTSQITVSAPAAITLTNSAPITIAAGAAAGNTSTLTVTPVDGFTGAVSLSCSVTTLPASATEPVTCGLTPASMTISGAVAGTAQLTINSTASETTTLSSSSNGTRGLPRGVGSTFFAVGVFIVLPSRRRRQLRGLIALAILISLGGMVGCSGGSGSTGATSTSSTQTGTSEGSYVVTVTAAAAGAPTQVATVSVTVN